MLESIRRRRIQFKCRLHDLEGFTSQPEPSPLGSHDQAGPSSLGSHDQAGLASGDEWEGVQTAVDESDSETSYEEYTWCNETRVRATSMLDPITRASKIPQ